MSGIDDNGPHPFPGRDGRRPFGNGGVFNGRVLFLRGGSLIDGFQYGGEVLCLDFRSEPFGLLFHIDDDLIGIVQSIVVKMKVLVVGLDNHLVAFRLLGPAHGFDESALGWFSLNAE